MRVVGHQDSTQSHQRRNLEKILGDFQSSTRQGPEESSLPAWGRGLRAGDLQIPACVYESLILNTQNFDPNIHYSTSFPKIINFRHLGLQGDTTKAIFYFIVSLCCTHHLSLSL